MAAWCWRAGSTSEFSFGVDYFFPHHMQLIIWLRGLDAHYKRGHIRIFCQVDLFNCKTSNFHDSISKL